MTMPTTGDLEGTFVGEIVRLYVNSELANYPALRDNANFTSYLSAKLSTMLMQITTWCASGKVPLRRDIERVEWPDGVWQMFKSKYLPHWFVLRFPVRMATREVERTIHTYFMCPHVNVPPSNPLHIQFMSTGSHLAQRMSKEPQHD
jgi:hypothetical protein